MTVPLPFPRHRSVLRLHIPQSIILIVVQLWCMIVVAHSAPGMERYPSELMNWMAESDEFAFIIERSRQKLGVWKTRNGEPVMVESYPCHVGSRSLPSEGGESSDPEGVFFLCSVVGEHALPQEFGSLALVTDFPRPIDRMRGWRDEAIWLLGGEASFREVRSFKGSIFLRNDQLKKVARYARVQRTPVILVDQIAKKTKAEIIEEEREVRSFVESWRKAWEAKDLATYVKCYSMNFQSENMDMRSWLQKRREVNQESGRIEVRTGPISLYAHGDLVTALFPFSYKSASAGTSGIRTLYISRSGGLKIVGEDYVAAIQNYSVSTTSAPRGRAGITQKSSNPARNQTSLAFHNNPAQAGSFANIESPRPAPAAVAMVPERLDFSGGKMQIVNSLAVWDKAAGAGESAERSRQTGGHGAEKSLSIGQKKHQPKVSSGTNRIAPYADGLTAPQKPRFVSHSIAAALYFSTAPEATEVPLIQAHVKKFEEPSRNSITKAR